MAVGCFTCQVYRGNKYSGNRTKISSLPGKVNTCTVNFGYNNKKPWYIEKVFTIAANVVKVDIF